MTPQQVKKALVLAGFEVFRTASEEVILADRVRENLILDSGVRLRWGPPMEVRVVLRAQKNDFPSEDAEALYARVRELGGAAVAAGFREVGASVTPVPDPSDRERTLDTFYEIVFAKGVDGGLENAVEPLKFAMSLEKTAPKGR